MKRLASNIKNYFRERWILVKASAINTFQVDTAYPLNNWGNIISALAYAITSLVFIDIIYSNVKTIAGYTRDEMLFFNLILQAIFILTWMFSARNILYVTEAVNSGELDLVLTKPIPSLFYMSTKMIDIYSVLRDYTLGIVLVGIAINENNLNIPLDRFMIGLLIMAFGFVICHCVHFMSALPVFWIGENAAFVDLFYFFEWEFVHGVPYEGFNFSKGIQILFTYILPLMIAGNLAVSVMLGKLDPIPVLIVSLVLCIVFLFILNMLWKVALRSYTSASS